METVQNIVANNAKEVIVFMGCIQRSSYRITCGAVGCLDYIHLFFIISNQLNFVNTIRYGKIKNMKQKMTREEWLGKALPIINCQSFGSLKIDRLVQAMGVTKGSFYWHFENRQDFILKLIEYWDNAFTRNVIEHIESFTRNPKERLLELMLFITDNQLAQYDFAIHALAQNEPVAFPAIKEVLNKRITFVAALFSAMGFTGNELKFRSRVTVMFMTQEQNSLLKEPKEEQRKRIKLAHVLFTNHNKMIL